MKKYKLVIFDLDGTLIDAYPAIAEGINQTLKSLGYPQQKPKGIKKSVGWGVERLIHPLVKEKDYPRAVEIYLKSQETLLPKMAKLLPGAKEVLKKLKGEGYKLAVASNRPSGFSTFLLKFLGIAQYFSFVLCADQINSYKPEAKILSLIMEKLRVSPGETLYVGDMALDAETGKRAGVKTIIVLTGSSSKAEVLAAEPFKVIKQLSRLLLLLNKNTLL
ncbi:MAG: hypothetical protein COS11_00335 [bacterium (Candidatus Ratteibacteria) CG01_land_8_20_14_3_00_40_19]|uniref:Phosphoglycolate phosphatase n=1 Tax=bacterium (Candidatus Ratteibacteria) CG01_land_8_20_14_3_00_40_19 TaxID=2014290 RepID=A0A2M7EAM8_9BACT|nr:MAG: hypothetical protein COS11_00335 [bacterium (Candidatus Ratteibacteria) CG01_land_8_20_14_3_00_40_19]